MSNRWKVLLAFVLLVAGPAGASGGYDASSHAGCDSAAPGLRLDCTIRVFGTVALDACDGDVCIVALDGGATGATPRPTPKTVRVTLDDGAMQRTLCREDEPLVSELTCTHAVLHRLVLPAGTCTSLRFTARLDAVSPMPLPSPRSFWNSAVVASATVERDVLLCRA